MLKTVFLALFVVMAFSSFIYAQNDAPKPYKFAEFGPTTSAKVSEKMKGFYEELNGLPTAQGYLVNYGSSKFIKARKGLLIKGIAFRKYDAARITFVDVLSNKRKLTIMWVVPQGAENPTP